MKSVPDLAKEYTQASPLLEPEQTEPNPGSEVILQVVYAHQVAVHYHCNRQLDKSYPTNFSSHHKKVAFILPHYKSCTHLHFIYCGFKVKLIKQKQVFKAYLAMFKFNKHHNVYHPTHCPHSPVSSNPVLENNQLGQILEVGKLCTTAGPENIWKVYDGWRKHDGKEVSIFVFEKKSAEKLHKPRRKETIAEILRSSVRQLERFRHPKILQVVYPLEEGPDTLAFAVEPVFSSLANLISAPATPSSLIDIGDKSGIDQHPVFLDLELRYGILQIIEALQFLHYSGRMIHRNITPANIIVTKRGTWKLAGLEFIDRASDVDGMEGVPVIAWTSKIPKMGQPELDYTAPEVQTTSLCSIMSDMFSLGMVITAIFNNGKPLIQSNHSNSQYLKQIEILDTLIQEFLPKVPVALHEAVQRLLCKEPRQRPTSQLLALIKYFGDPAVHTLQFLDVISMKDPSQKAHFYRHQLRDVLPYIPKKLWFQHVWPTLQSEMKTQEVLAAALQPIFLLINESTSEEFQNIILPSFKQVFASPKSIQATVTLLENLHIVLEKNPHQDLLNNDILPMLQNAFESTTIQVQSASLIAASLIADYLDETFIRKIILPKTKHFYEKYSGDLKVVLNILMCLEKIIPKLERSTIIEDVLPILCENAKSQDPDIILKVVHIYRLMLSDNKKYGLSVNLMATRVMPSLLPQTVNPRLHLEQFSTLLEVLQEMLDHIDRNQRNKLKLDHLAPTHASSHGHGQSQKEYTYSKTNSKSLRHQRSSDNMNIGPFGSPMFVPNVHIETTASMSGPSLPCQRKTSSAEDMMMRKNSTAELYGDGTNFLRVQGGQFPIRRLSDNTLMAPKIRLAPSSALSSPGEPLPIRRHSSIGPQERKNSSNSVNLSPPMVSPSLTRNIVVRKGGSMPNTTGNIVPFSLSGSMTSLKSRRPSMLSSSSTSMHSHGNQQTNTTGILQQLGSGVVSFANSLVDRSKSS